MGQLSAPPASTSAFSPLQPDKRTVLLILAWTALGTFLACYDYLAAGPSRADDDSSHLAEILTIAQVLKSGQSDFWHDRNVLGYPLFITYQPAPSFLMGVLVILTESFLSPFLLYKLSVVALWAFMPACWYLGGRAMGFRRGPALFFGLFVLMIRDAWDFGAGLNTTVHYGLYTQLWASALLPLTLGNLYRFVCLRESRAIVPVSLLTATILCHSMAGLLCAIASALLLVLRISHAFRRLRRLTAVWSAAAVLSGFWLLPFFLNYRHQGGFPWKWETSDGYGLAESLGKALRGDLVDARSVPWLTLLSLVGIAVSLRRWRHRRTRWMLLCGAAYFALWMGPATWGPFYRSLPLHGELQVVRYVMGLQIIAVFFAAQGTRILLDLADRAFATSQGQGLRAFGRIFTPVALSLLGGLLLWNWIALLKGSMKTFDHSTPPYEELVRVLEASPGRFLCHEGLRTADPMHFNLLPVLSGRPHLRTYGRGYHDTHSMYYLDDMQMTPEDLALYNVQRVVAKRPPSALPESWKKVWAAGEYSVYGAPTPSGYFEFIRAPMSLSGSNLKSIRELVREVYPVFYQKRMLPILEVASNPQGDRIETAGHGRHSLIIDGSPVARDVSAGKIKYELLQRLPEFRPIRSTVHEEKHQHNEYRALVSGRDETELLLLKVSYHPYWTVIVDGTHVPVLQLAPNLMAVRVPPGHHLVVATYRNPRYQKIWFVASTAGWLAWVAWTILSFRKSLAFPRSPSGVVLRAPRSP